MTYTETKEAAARIVDELLRDLKDRRGLRQEWEALDEDVQEEIKATWEDIVGRELWEGPRHDH